MNDFPAHPPNLDHLPAPLRARIEAELVPGERLLWASQPDPNRPRGPKRARVSAWVWVAGWSAFGGASVLGLSILPAEFASRSALLVVAIIASVLGVSLLVAYLLSAATAEGSWQRRARLELYALTDRRALLWSPAVGSNALAIRQVFPGTIPAATVERVEYPDGSGNLTFLPATDGSGPDGFFGVAEVRRVDELVRSVLIPSIPHASSASLFDPDDPEEPF